MGTGKTTSMTTRDWLFEVASRHTTLTCDVYMYAALDCDVFAKPTNHALTFDSGI